MKKYFLIIVISLIALTTYAQDIFFSRVVQKEASCNNIAEGSVKLFIDFYQKGNYDSASLVLAYLIGHCGESYTETWARIILNIEMGVSVDTILQGRFLPLILAGKKQRIYYDYYQSSSFRLPVDFFAAVKARATFNNFLQQKADVLRKREGLSPIELILCESKAGYYDYSLDLLQLDDFKGTELRKQYDNEIEKELCIPDGYYGIFGGVRMPTGGLKPLGNAMEIGMVIGFSTRKCSYDLILSFHTSDSVDAFPVQQNGQIVMSNHSDGFFVGIEASRNFRISKLHQFGILSGIGFETLYPYERPIPEGIKYKNIVTYNLRFGFVYELFVEDNTVLFVKTRYNIIDYTLQNIVNMKGNQVTASLGVRLLVGFEKARRLKALRYKGGRG